MNFIGIRNCRITRYLGILICCCLLPVSIFASEGMENGAEVPAFTLSDVQGTPWVLEDLLKKGPVAIAFFRTDCSHCQVELPILGKLSREETYRGVQFLAVNVREKAEVIEPFIIDNNITFPVVLDPKMTVTRSYKVPSIPRLFFVRKDGTLNSSAASISEDAIRDHLDTLISNGTGPSTQKVVLIVPSRESIEGAELIKSAESSGYTPVVWDMDEKGHVTEEFLIDYAHDPVFRCVPDKGDSYLINRSEEVALLGYISDGGKLVLCGNDVLKKTKDLEIIQYYLEVSYEGDESQSLAVEGVPSDPDFSSFRIALKEKTENGVVRPDVISSDSEDARCFLRYKNAGLADECAAILVKT